MNANTRDTGTKRSDTTKRTMEVLASYREEHKRLREVNTELLDALKQWEIMLSVDCTDGRTLTAVRKLIAKATGDVTP